jgi:hypothetical protein
MTDKWLNVINIMCHNGTATATVITKCGRVWKDHALSLNEPQRTRASLMIIFWSARLYYTESPYMRIGLTFEYHYLHVLLRCLPVCLVPCMESDRDKLEGIYYHSHLLWPPHF